MVVSQICSVGWEPNPGHAPYLAELESHYRECGHRLTINTHTGVGRANTRAKFARMSQVSESQSRIGSNFLFKQGSRLVS